MTAPPGSRGAQVYVQSLLRSHGGEAWAMLEAGAAVYVCGATAMGKDVHEAFVALASAHGGMDTARAGAHVKQLQASGRYIQELW